MKPSPEDAFDRWAKDCGFRGRDPLNDQPASLRNQMRSVQKMFNEAFENEKPSSLHSPTLPLYFDYLDGDDKEAAIAADDGEHYAFVGITRRMVTNISDFCIQMSRLDGKVCRALPLRPSAIPHNELQAVLFYTLLTFVVAHEWSHHKHGHCRPFPNSEKIADQIEEIAADGYSAFHVLAHLFDSRSSFLPFLMFNPAPTEEVLDQIFGHFLSLLLAATYFYVPRAT